MVAHLIHTFIVKWLVVCRRIDLILRTECTLPRSVSVVRLKECPEQISYPKTWAVSA